MNQAARITQQATQIMRRKFLKALAAMQQFRIDFCGQAITKGIGNCGVGRADCALFHKGIH